MTGPKQVTDKQLAANRRNAQLSTGPRTPEGIAVSRYNALTHGILASAVIPEALEPYESREAFDALLAALHEEFAPATAMEELLVEQIAVAYWRLARLYRAEAGAIARERDIVAARRANPSALDRLREMQSPPPRDPLAERLERITQALPRKDRLRKLMCETEPALAEASDPEISAAAEHAMRQLSDKIGERQARHANHREAVDSADASLPGLETIAVYSRYEAALQHHLHRALDTLERLQRRRAGEAVPPPARLGITVDLAGAAGLSDAAHPPKVED